MRYNQLFESNEGFVLHPALDPANYQITNSLRDIKNWRAMTYIDNNGEGGIGQMGNVGYVMISLVDNTIVPISRGDEHHEGEDLMWTFLEGDRKLGIKAIDINPNDYIPIWSGNNYIHDRSKAPKLALALKKFLSYGGVDGIVVGSNDMRGKKLHASDFVAAGGQFAELVHNELAPIGKRIYDQFKSLSEMIVAADDNDDRIKLRPIFIAATSLCKYLSGELSFMHMDLTPVLKEAPSKLRELQKANDLQGLREYMFGFHGVKNVMHVGMKKLAATPDSWDYTDSVAIWGDLELAIDLLAKL